MIVLDTETTGIDPKTRSIIQIGALDFDNPLNQFFFECRAFSGAKIDKEAIAVHGISEKKILDENLPTEAEAIVSFVGWTKNIKDTTLVGENPSFDRDFIKEAAIRAGVGWWNHVVRTVDLHSISYAKHLELGLALPIKNNHSGINLDVTLKLVGLPLRKGFHNALEDAKLEAEAFSRIVGGKNLLSEFKEYKIPKFLLKTKKS